MVKKIQVDLDGVLADFDAGADLAIRKYFNKPKSEASKRELWQSVGLYQKEFGETFWLDLPLMSDAMQLWSYVISLKIPVEILSACGNKGFNADPQKRVWCQRHLSLIGGGPVVVNLTETSPQKAAYAAGNIVLIDDRSKSIDPWVEAGGIGILHVNATETIAKLNKLLYR